MKRILLAEDDTDFALVLKQYLEIHNFKVTRAKDGIEAWELFQKKRFDICLFDVMMPKLDGFTLAEKCLENNPEVPFIFLTARNQSEDKIKGLRLGADDYIVKPFQADELVLRLNNILKRTYKNQSFDEKDEIIDIGQYQFDTRRQELRFNEKRQQLTEKEAALIDFLYHHRNQMLRRQEVLWAVWKTDDFFSGRSMDVFISRLRKYFADDPSISIESLRNIGLEFKITES